VVVSDIKLGDMLFVSVSLFCPAFWHVSTAFEVHKYMDPNRDVVQWRICVRRVGRLAEEIR